MPRPAAPPPPPPIPAGLTADSAPPESPDDLGAALVDRTLLYWWPDDGWQRESRRDRGAPLPACRFQCRVSHVVAYTRQRSVLRSTADSLLDAASYGTRWVLLSPAPAAGPGVVRALRSRGTRP